MIRSLAIGMLAGSTLIPQHPLGNFTVNRYDGLVAAPHELRIDHVQDLAEIPAAQVLEGRADLTGWATRACATAGRIFQITESGRQVRATVRAAAARTRPGQAGSWTAGRSRWPGGWQRTSWSPGTRPPAGDRCGRRPPCSGS